MMNTVLKLVLLFATHKSALGNCNDGSCKSTKPAFNDEVSLLTIKTQLHKAAPHLTDVTHEAEKEDWGHVGADVEEWAPNNNCDSITQGCAGGGEVGCFGPANTGSCNKYFMWDPPGGNLHANLGLGEVLMCRNTQGVHAGCRVHGSHTTDLTKRHSPWLMGVINQLVAFSTLMIQPNPAIMPAPAPTSGCELVLTTMGPGSQVDDGMTSAQALFATDTPMYAMFQEAIDDEAHLRAKQTLTPQQMQAEVHEDGDPMYTPAVLEMSEAELQYLYDRSSNTAQVYQWLMDELTNNPMDAVQFAQFRNWLQLYCHGHRPGR